jgi:hypothetical protein
MTPASKTSTGTAKNGRIIGVLLADTKQIMQMGGGTALLQKPQLEVQHMDRRYY